MKNLSLIDHMNRLNPTGIKWENMTQTQRTALRNRWDAVISDPKNLECEDSGAFVERYNSCRSCMAIHRHYGSLPYCLQRIDDFLAAGVLSERRHNIHAKMDETLSVPVNRDVYKKRNEDLWRKDPEAAAERQKKDWEQWDCLVNDPENTVCTCKKTCCPYHNDCKKCIALHRYYDGVPSCCQDIHDQIECAAQAYWDEVADEIWSTVPEEMKHR